MEPLNNGSAHSLHFHHQHSQLLLLFVQLQSTPLDCDMFISGVRFGGRFTAVSLISGTISILDTWDSFYGSFFSCPEQLNRWPCHSLTQWPFDFGTQNNPLLRIYDQPLVWTGHLRHFLTILTIYDIFWKISDFFGKFQIFWKNSRFFEKIRFL